MPRLSPVQVSVIEALSNEGAKLIESKLYHWNKVVQGDKVIIRSIHRPTVNFLKNNNIIEKVKDQDGVYTLRQNYNSKNWMKNNGK